MPRPRVSILRMMVLVAFAAVVAAVLARRDGFRRSAVASEADMDQVVRQHPLCQIGRFQDYLDRIRVGREVLFGAPDDISEMIFRRTDEVFVMHARAAVRSRRAMGWCDATLIALGVLPIGLLLFRCRAPRPRDPFPVPSAGVSRLRPLLPGPHRRGSSKKTQ